MVSLIFVELDFEIGPVTGILRESGCHIWSNYSSIMPKHINIPKTELCVTLLVFTFLQNSYIMFDKNWTTIG